MRSSRARRLLVVLGLVLLVDGGAAFLVHSWLPLIFSLPWLVPIIWFGAHDPGQLAEFPSTAEAMRGRLWTPR